MSSSALARRYAKALLDLGTEESSVETLTRELAALEQALDESPELAATLFTPTVEMQDKRNIAAAVLDKLNASETTRNFVGLLVLKGRFGSFREIRSEFARLADEAMGKVRAQVRTARPLTDDLTRRIKDKLGTVTGKQVELEVTVDPDLLGGLVADVDGVIYDASVRSQLRALQNTARSE